MASNNTTSNAKADLLLLIKKEIRSVTSQENSQILRILSMMEAIVKQLNVQRINMEKENRYWNIAFNYSIDSRYDFSPQALNQAEKYTKENIILLNSLQALIDALGAVLTHRPLTHLSAAYSTKAGKIKTAELNPIEFYRVQNLAKVPFKVSISKMRSILIKAERNFEEDKTLTRLMANKQLQGINRGHIFERLGRYTQNRTTQRISKKLLRTISEGRGDNVSWNKGGDDREKQKKFLGSNSSGSLMTASLLSIEEITSYFMQLKINIQQIVGNEELLNKQAEAIYKGFVDVERKNFYNSGSFEAEAINEFLDVIQTTLQSNGVSFSI